MSRPEASHDVEPFTVATLDGEVSRELGPCDLEELRRLLDPASSVRTVHWGRNYVYEATMNSRGREIPVVVKAFRGDGLKRRLSRWLHGASKARRAWRASWAMRRAGVDVPAPVAIADSLEPGGPSYFVSAFVPDAVEVRYLFRAMNAGSAEDRFPSIDVERLLTRLGETIRRAHDAGLWHRDVSAGNVLLSGDWNSREEEGRLVLIDLSRTRVGRRLTRNERMRDLCRLPLERPVHRSRLLHGYAGGEPSHLDRCLYEIAYRSFATRNSLKAHLRGVRGLLRGLRSRSTHSHIPPPAPGESPRDRVVWDELSDQPHLHAGRLAKTGARLRDASIHLREAGVVLRRLPATWSCYRRLQRSLYRRPVEWGDLGVGLHVGSRAPEDLLRLLEECRTRHVLLRVHPWEEDLAADREMAVALRERGRDLLLAIPQSRALVNDLGAWRRSLERIRDSFGDLVQAIQIGQAINRSKWGIWNLEEYCRLLGVAGEVLGGLENVRLVGPAVIDFEFHRTSAVLSWPRLPVSFDAVSSLLYVDRRGAPENRQAGLDTADKVVLLRALIQASRLGERPSWVTEVNWPLREGPHSPAGRHVAVDERRQADYLARYVLLAMATGCVERVYWWQLVAKGYGLVDAADGELRRRPALRAFAALQELLSGGRSLGPVPAPEPVRLLALEAADGGRWLAAWCGDDSTRRWESPVPVIRALSRDGEELASERSLQVTGSPLYLELAEPAVVAAPGATEDGTPGRGTATDTLSP